MVTHTDQNYFEKSPSALSLFKIPVRMANKLESFNKTSFNGTGSKKMGLIMSSEAVRPKRKGGSTIGKVEDKKSTTLTSKWWWRFGDEQE